MRRVQIQGEVQAGTAGLRKAESKPALWAAKGMAGSASASRAGRDAGQGRRLAGDHGGGDVVDSRGLGRNGNLGVDQGVEESAVAPALEIDADDGDFDDAVGRRVEAGGLDVDDESGSGRVCSHVRILF